jgi:formate hydrogenlyase subunit 3/multisubunit Na+/H+ antiporter MnhD subunit
MSDMPLPPLLICIIVLPLAAGTLSFLAGRRGGAWLGISAALGELLLTGLLARGVLADGPFRYAVGGWGAPLGIDLYVDGLSALSLLVTSVVGVAITVYASGYFNGHHEHAPPAAFFWPLWLFLWGGLNALFLSADIFNLYVTLEVLTFSAVALVAFAGTPACLSAATRYLILALFGSLAYLLGVGVIYSAHGVLDLETLAGLLQPGWITATAITLMTLGLAIKTALFPMHFWLPPAHAHAPAPVSALLSALVVTGSFYLLVRLWSDPFAAAVSASAGQVLGAMGGLAILWGSVQALRQPRLKMLVAYSTVAQLGYAFLLFGLAGEDAPGRAFAWSGGIYFALSHACAKAAAFMAAGAIMSALGHDRIAEFRGLARLCPIPVFAFAIAGVSLVGLPPSGGFIGKWLLLKAAMLNGQWGYVAVLIAGGLLAAGYVFRVLESALAAPGPSLTLVRPLRRLTYSALALALVAVALGVVASWPLDLLGVGAPYQDAVPWGLAP